LITCPPSNVWKIAATTSSVVAVDMTTGSSMKKCEIARP